MLAKSYLSKLNKNSKRKGRRKMRQRLTQISSTSSSPKLAPHPTRSVFSSLGKVKSKLVSSETIPTLMPTISMSLQSNKRLQPRSRRLKKFRNLSTDQSKREVV